MKTLALLSILLLASCAGSAKMNADGSVTINGPMMARADRLAVNVKTQTGSMKFMLVNGNAEAVPIEAFRTAAALGVGIAQINATKASDASKAANDAAKIKANSTPIPPTITPEGVVIPPVFPPQQ